MLKIVKVSHIDYKLVPDKKKVYYFKTDEDVKTNDYVYCDTCNGLMIGVVEEVYTTLEEIIEIKNLPLLINLKECRLTLKERAIF